MTRALLLGALLGALVANPNTARAGDSQAMPVVCEKIPRCVEQTELAIRQAATDREAALATTQDAYRQYPDPLLCYNLGRLLHQLSRFSEAVEQYRCFLNSGLAIPPERLSKTRTFLEQAEQELAKTPPPPPPPTSIVTLPPIVVPPPPSVVTPPPKVTEKVPVYKKWWFWTIVGSVAAAGIAGGTAGGVIASQNRVPEPGFRPFDISR